MRKTYSDNANISVPMERVLSRDSLYDIEFQYKPWEDWYKTTESVERFLTDSGKEYIRKTTTGWIHNPCMYITAKYSGRRGEKDVLIITDRKKTKTYIYYIDKL